MTHAIHYNLSHLSELDIYLFKQGTHTKLYEKLGSHKMKYKRKSGVYFAVWAPNAQFVSVRGDFNDYATDTHPLKLREDESGIWEGFIEAVEEGLTYIFRCLGTECPIRLCAW